MAVVRGAGADVAEAVEVVLAVVAAVVRGGVPDSSVSSTHRVRVTGAVDEVFEAVKIWVTGVEVGIADVDMLLLAPVIMPVVVALVVALVVAVAVVVLVLLMLLMLLVVLVVVGLLAVLLMVVALVVVLLGMVALVSTELPVALV